MNICYKCYKEDETGSLQLSKRNSDNEQKGKKEKNKRKRCHR